MKTPTHIEERDPLLSKREYKKEKMKKANSNVI